MFRNYKAENSATSCFPRVCGDVPEILQFLLALPLFSPRMRGCSPGKYRNRPLTCVFPAYAGMFLIRKNFHKVQLGFPRVCGDVPPINPPRPTGVVFSPRMRGCSVSKAKKDFRGNVFPAYAGMFPGASRKLYGVCCFPRVCGDVPDFQKRALTCCLFSPRMRGCSD